MQTKEPCIQMGLSSALGQHTCHGYQKCPSSKAKEHAASTFQRVYLHDIMTGKNEGKGKKKKIQER